jgi:hypothetical protein
MRPPTLSSTVRSVEQVSERRSVNAQIVSYCIGQTSFDEAGKDWKLGHSACVSDKSHLGACLGDVLARRIVHASRRHSAWTS